MRLGERLRNFECTEQAFHCRHEESGLRICGNGDSEVGGMRRRCPDVAFFFHFDFVPVDKNADELYLLTQWKVNCGKRAGREGLMRNCVCLESPGEACLAPTSRMNTRRVRGTVPARDNNINKYRGTHLRRGGSCRLEKDSNFSLTNGRASCTGLPLRHAQWLFHLSRRDQQSFWKF